MIQKDSLGRWLVTNGKTTLIVKTEADARKFLKLFRLESEKEKKNENSRETR